MCISQKLQHRQQKGVTSFLIVLFIMLFCVFILVQSHYISGNKQVDDAFEADSTAALYQAESGVQRAAALLYAAINTSNSTTTFISTCSNTNNYPSSGYSINSTTGFSYKYAYNSSDLSCNISSTGSVGKATRTIIRNIGYLSILGFSGKSKNNTCNTTIGYPMDYPNYASSIISAIAIPIQALTADCSATSKNYNIRQSTSPSCNSPVTNSSIYVNSPTSGSGGASSSFDSLINSSVLSVPATASTVSYLVGLTDSTCMAIGSVELYSNSSSTAPAFQGVYPTANSNSPSGNLRDTKDPNYPGSKTALPNNYLQNTITGSSWCNPTSNFVAATFAVLPNNTWPQWPALDRFNISLSNLQFNTDSTGSNGLAMKQQTYYPTTSATSSSSFSGSAIRTEIWSLMNPAFPSSNGLLPVKNKATATTSLAIDLSSLTTQQTTSFRSLAGTYIQFSSSPCKNGCLTPTVPVLTKITNVSVAGNTGNLTLNNSVSLNNGDIVCAGICGTFNPSGNTAFSFTTTSTGATTTYPMIDSWAASFTCMSGVSNIQAANSLIVKPGSWHEPLSN